MLPSAGIYRTSTGHGFKKIAPLVEIISLPDMDAQPVQEAVRDAEEMINNARKPVIVAGVELMRFGLEGALLELAERTNIPIASSMKDIPYISASTKEA